MHPGEMNTKCMNYDDYSCKGETYKTPTWEAMRGTWTRTKRTIYHHHHHSSHFRIFESFMIFGED